MLSFSTLLLICLVASFALLAEAFINNCVNGAYTCLSTDTDFSITASSLTIQNCVYTKCPAVVIQTSGASVTLNGVYFYYSRNPNGAIIVNNTNVALTITNGGFFHGTHGGLATVNVATTGANVNIQNTQFYNNTGMRSAGVGLMFGGTLTVRNGTFLKNSVNAGDGAMGVRVSSGGSVSFYNSEFGFQGKSIMADTVSNVYVKNCYFHDLFNNNEGGLAVKNVDRCTTLIEDSLAVNVITNNDQGGALRIGDGSVITVRRCNFINCRSKQGGVMLLENPGTMAYIYDSTFTNCVATIDGGALYMYNYPKMYLYNNFFLGCSCPQGGTLSSNFNTEFNLVNNTIINSSGTRKGIVNVQRNSAIYSRDLTILNSIGSNALQVESSPSTAILSGTTIIANTYNVLSEAGALGSIGGCLIVLNDKVRIYNNTGTKTGALWANENGKYQFNSTDIVIQNNTAKNDGRAGGMYGQSTQTPDGLLVTTGAPILGITDNFLIVTKEYATGIIVNNVASMLPNAFIFGNPSAVQLVPGTNLATNMNLLLSQTLPNIKVRVIDYFGNLVPANPYNPIIIAIQEKSQNAQLSGESIKAVLDTDLNYVEFSGVGLKTVSPGFYSFLVTPVGNIVDQLPTPIRLPAFNVTFLACDANTERLIADENKCYPAVTLNTGIRAAFGALNVLVAILGVLGVGAIQAYREYHLVKANSHFFLSVIGAGCSLSALSYVVQVSSYKSSCMLSYWLGNLGMTLIFTSLILKTSRIQQIFLKSIGQAKILKDGQMLTILGIVVLVISAYLIAWSAVSPSSFTEVYFYGQNVLVDSCSKSTFSDVAILIRLFVQLISAYLAYSIRQVPSDFNESKQIGFTTYNWIIFGAVFEVIQDYAVTDPNVSFAIGGASIFLTNLLTLSILIYSKVYNCYFYPETSKKPPKVVSGGAASGGQSGSSVNLPSKKKSEINSGVSNK